MKFVSGVTIGVGRLTWNGVPYSATEPVALRTNGSSVLCSSPQQSTGSCTVAVPSARTGVGADCKRPPVNGKGASSEKMTVPGNARFDAVSVTGMPTDTCEGDDVNVGEPAGGAAQPVLTVTSVCGDN